MIELDKRAFPKILPLLRAAQANLESFSVAEGMNPGFVFVDRRESPTAALVYSKGNDGFYFIGRMDGPVRDSFDALLDQTLIPRVRKRRGKWLEISAVDQGQNEALLSLLSRRNATSWSQTVFRYEKGARRGSFPASSPNIRDVTDALSTAGLQNPSFLRRNILDCWESLDHFRQNGKGYCWVERHEVVSCCFTGWATHDACEFTIETLPTSRRRGYARACAEALLHRCEQTCSRPHWECETRNIASYQLAVSLGFVKDYDYTCYGIPV